MLLQHQSDPMMQVSRFALFLGDLSMHCSEADLEEAFAPYGTIVEIRVKRSKETAKTLSYGFLEFASASSAVNAMNDMDGVVLKGRPLRIRWAASKKNPVRKRDIREDLNERISMHVKFMSYKIDKVISEELIRNLFSIYGEVCDTTIKQISIDRKSHRLKGYGFVSYYNDEAGFNAAQRALSELHDMTLDDVTYKCELSNILDSPPPYAPGMNGNMHGGMQGNGMYQGNMGMGMGMMPHGELGFDAMQQQSSYYDDYCGNNGAFPEDALYSPASAAFDASPFERSTSIPIAAASPGAIGSSVSGSSKFPSLSSSLEHDPKDMSPSTASLEIRAPSSLLTEELRDPYAFSPMLGSGGVHAASPGRSTLSAASPGFLPASEAGADPRLTQRPLNPAPRPTLYAPQGQFQHPNNNRYQQMSPRDGTYGPGNYSLQHQHSAPEPLLSHYDNAPRPQQFVRRSNSGGAGMYQQQTNHPYPPRQHQQQHQQQFWQQGGPAPYSGYSQGTHPAGPPNGGYQNFSQLSRYQEAGVFQGQGQQYLQGSPQGYGQQPPRGHQPIYARSATPPMHPQSPSLSQQSQLPLPFPPAQQQRDLLSTGYDFEPTSRSPSIGTPRSVYGDLPLDAFKPASTPALQGQISSPGSSLSLQGFGLGSSSTAEPFPLSHHMSRSGSSTTSGGSVFGMPLGQQAAPTLGSAVGSNSSSGVAGLADDCDLSGRNSDPTLGLPNDSSLSLTQSWFASNFDLPQM